MSLEVGNNVKLVGGSEGQRGQEGQIKRVDSKRMQVQLKDGKTVWRDVNELEKIPDPPRPRAGSVKDRAMQLDQVEQKNTPGSTPKQAPLPRVPSNSSSTKAGMETAAAEDKASRPRGSSIKELAAQFEQGAAVSK